MTADLLHLNGNEVRVGDELQDLWFLQGGPGQVKTLQPYKGLLLSVVGEGTQIASFYGTNLEMTLCAKSWYVVRRPSDEVAAQVPDPACYSRAPARAHS